MWSRLIRAPQTKDVGLVFNSLGLSPRSQGPARRKPRVRIRLLAIRRSTFNGPVMIENLHVRTSHACVRHPNVQVNAYHLRVRASNARVTADNLRQLPRSAGVSAPNLQIQSSNLHVRGPNVRVTACNLFVPAPDSRISLRVYLMKRTTTYVYR